MAPLASSGGDPGVATAHFLPADKDWIDTARFACVTAASCMVADALTKDVLASGLDGAGPCLAHYGASAHSFSPADGWRSLESTR